VEGSRLYIQRLFGGILGRREHQGDLSQLAEYEIPELDLVIVDLYPFEDTVASGASEEEISLRRSI
jgi:phosphoribosylaminoimidazolecarboxamide formyltransferase/IMP cyclohydrolase